MNLIEQAEAEVKARVARIAELERENAELRKDKARLDKLEATMRRTLGAPSPERSISGDVHMGASIRDAIDKHL